MIFRTASSSGPKRLRCHGVTLLLSLAAMAASVAEADVRVNGLFGDNMVLQRDQPVTIWGTADAGEDVTVEFGTQKKTAQVQDGRWQVVLDPLQASSQPATLTVRGHQVVTFQNVLVGEVWIASGQSNMAFPLSNASNAATEIPQAGDPLLRLYSVPRVCTMDPQTTVAGKWEASTPDSVKNFSAVAYFFGKGLRADLKCPVGLINSSWGGTTAQTWTSLDALRKSPPLQNFIDQWNKAVAAHQNVVAHPELMTAYTADLAQWRAEVEPAYKAALEQYNAAGATGPKPQPSRPEPTNPDPMAVPSSSVRPFTPSIIFNGMIAPLVPFTMRGVIWYQGEANGRAGLEYRTLFPCLITDWRSRWGEGDFPFLYVQLPGWGPDTKPATEGDWPGLREAQLMTLSLPETGMATTIDIGDPKNVHPKDKVDVGNRLCLLARKIAYHENVQAFGPLYAGSTVAGNQMTIQFKETGSGLTIGAAPWVADGNTALPTDRLVGFTVAGADGHFVDADARIVGDTVEVSSPQVQDPSAVHYAWANSPRANLFNKEGLPASPFRTENTQKSP